MLSVIAVGKGSEIVVDLSDSDSQDQVAEAAEAAEEAEGWISQTQEADQDPDPDDLRCVDVEQQKRRGLVSLFIQLCHWKLAVNKL